MWGSIHKSRGKHVLLRFLFVFNILKTQKLYYILSHHCLRLKDSCSTNNIKNTLKGECRRKK